jgi:hypothetical protein
MGLVRTHGEWQPYEAGYAENSILLSSIPARYYRKRWMLMHRNPLCWQVGKWQWTYGEATTVALIVGQMLWIALHVIIGTNGMRTNVKATGALHFMHNHS